MSCNKIRSTPAASCRPTSPDRGRESRANGDLSMSASGIAATSEDLDQIWEWNSTVPISVERRIYDLIDARVQAQPNAPAVCAWDGMLTYGELDQLAAKLASKLRMFGVSQDVFVPLCFEKSMWTTVAVYGVIKAGGAFVLLDPSLPEQRLQVIIRQLRASVVLSSASNGERSARLAERVIIINRDFFNAIEFVDAGNVTRQTCPSDPSSLLYAVFTSGSTGMPKGVLITNTNAASALHHQADAMGMNQYSRIFDFASYSFDVSVSNVLSALTTGGCLCVPSDQDRKDNLERSIASLQANILDITPSMAQVLSPDRIPLVKSVIFGGEALHPADIKRWWGKVQIIHIYGPCECTPTSTINYNIADPGEAVHVGKGVGLVTWIVDPEDHHILLPPGCTGELLLEGPLVGRGYLNDDAKTAAAFIEDPLWLLRGTSTKPGRRGRLYKTGDLVQYTKNGCLKFVGRNQATQVKIRGQRLELGEIEHTLRNHDRVVEAVASLQHEGGQEPRIVSFVTVGNDDAADVPTDNAREAHRPNQSKSPSDSEPVPITGRNGQIDRFPTTKMLRKQNRQRIEAELYEMLQSTLPSYMIPQMIQILDRMPLNRNGKIDRLELVKSLQGRIQLPGSIRQPVSKAERQMREVWAQVLNVEISTIGSDSSFFVLGGSSIAAMKVVAEMRKVGVKLSVADIFHYPVLHKLVEQSHQESLADKRDDVFAPFALLSNESALDSILQEICIQYHLEHLDGTDGTTHNSPIHDAYPCTPLQQGLMSLTSMSPGSYIGQSVLEISSDASVEKLCSAWEQVVRDLPILRTRLVHHDHLGLVQIVIDEPLKWIKANCLDDYLASDIEQPMDLGQQLTRYALVKDGTGNRMWFVWTIHHALFDGWSIDLILDAVRKTYQGKPFQRGPQFQAFIKNIQHQDSNMMRDYWLNALDGCQCAPFPSLPPHVEYPMARSSVEHSFPRPLSDRLGITPPIMIRAAWALLVGEITSADDVVFGATVFGRNAPVAGIEMMVGPTFATVPVRVKWNKNDRAIEFLRAAQQQATGMIEYEQIGLKRLAELSPDARQACMFQTLLVVQPEEVNDGSDELGVWRSDLGRGNRFDSYGLMLVAQLGAAMVRITASFDSGMIESWRVSKLLNRLGHIISQLDQTSPDVLLSEIETATPEDLEQIWNWNHTVPKAAEQCIHKLFEQAARTQPQASAVCAWDGSWTYSELDKASTRLAYYLVSLGVGLEQIVPLCFEKSRWTPVAMLAVMKAGGASVALDSTQPEERLRTIVQQTEPAILLSSSVNQELASRLSHQHVVVVDEGLLASLNSVTGAGRLPVVSPSNKLYVAFTSGSTGLPKGAIISHSNFSSAIQHIRASNFGRVEPLLRVYDFASYAFDISWFNSLQSLTSGGCLCIPSEADRRDDLAGSIRRLQATFVILTPSTANILPLETIQSLQTLMLAGEALPSEFAKRWTGLTRLTNGYGPCECTPITTIAAIDGESVGASSIGKGVGVNTWVVQASNHNHLVAVGDVGELVLEGPLVGYGYLGDAEQTAAAFIHDPIWLRDGAPGHSGRRGRLYKTGDLVRYSSDGSLVFVGRKDANQVKIRGQRVELGDVEHHVRVSIPTASQVVAEVILPTDRDGQGRPTLAAFLVHDHPTGLSPAAQVTSVSAEVSHELAKRLPGYMIPTVYFSFHEFPTNSSGKIDRRHLRQFGAGFTIQQLAQLSSASVAEKRAPATIIERTLQEIWARVLAINATSISADDSFFRLGGDSITAMQASAAARGFNINISAADILRSKTISSLAAAASASKNHFTNIEISDAKGDDGRPFELSPIQRLYVKAQPDPRRCFDQNFLLKLRKPTSFAILAKATETIVMRHPMLRARFGRTGNGTWKQRIVNDAFESFHLSEVVGAASASPSTARDIRQCRERLNIETGPILAAVLFDNPQSQTVFITVHHLVIDLVSWRILLEELECLLTNCQLPAIPATNFRAWCSLQARYATENLCKEWPSQLKPSPLSYWGLEIEEIVQGATASKEFMLDATTSTALLGACNEAFGTRPVELMIAALVCSFSTIFADRSLPVVFNEGHGREPWDDCIDLSRTMGWFTTISPAFVPDGAVLDLMDAVRRTKDSVRKLSKNGWSYFTSRFSNETNSTLNAADFPVEVLLNFAGSYQQLERDGSIFESLSILDSCHPESWLKLRRLALFEFNAQMDKGQLLVSLEYPKNAQCSDLIETWIASYEDVLTQLAVVLVNKPPEWTLSDFPMAFTSYADMEEFRSVAMPRLGLGNARDIEDIFPCTGLQEGMLVAQFKSLDNYRVMLEFEIVATEASEDYIELSRIERSWQAVVRRHALLRSILVDVMPGSSRTMHVVLKDPTPMITFNPYTSEASGDSRRVRGQACLKYGKYDLQHQLNVSRVDDKHVRICFQVSHVILDGHSIGIMLRDFWQAYNGTPSLDAPSYGDFIKYVEKRPRDADREFWAKYLEGVKPCLFPASTSATEQMKDITVAVSGLDTTAIHNFCSKWEVTTASVIQTAWALVLYHYTGCTNPCFGNLASCRDVPIDRVEDVFGPVIGMVPYRVQLDGGRSVVEILREAQNDFTDSLPHQTLSLMEVHEALGVGSSGLFNSILSFQRADNQLSPSRDEHTIQELGSNDPVEYPVSLSVGDSATELSINMNFKANFIVRTEADRVAKVMGTAVSSLISGPHEEISIDSILTGDDLQRIWTWNKEVPTAEEKLANTLVEEQARLRPDAKAVCARDGELTYKELDSLASILAHRLAFLGVGPDTWVPLCFEKSMWTPVAALAALKAGAGFVLLDPSFPEQRLQSIVEQLNPRVVLTSSLNLDLSARLCQTVVQVGPELAEAKPLDMENPKSLTGTPAAPMYIVFTCGSTDAPTGMVFSHTNFCSALKHQSHLLGFSPSSRVFDTVSYAPDLSVFNMFATFATGGCMCIPSEKEKQDNVSQSIADFEATLVIVTPSVARLIDPPMVPELKTIILTGEPVSISDANRWWSKVQLINAYRPSACNISTINGRHSCAEEVVSIGRGMGLVTWVVDSGKHDSLLPPGCVGELVLEGPLLGCGYPDDRGKDDDAFINDPKWLLTGIPGKQQGRHGRCYKTGDLVQYNTDGSLMYVGRKEDTRVMIHGQRVKLEEVEYWTQSSMSEVGDVAAEIIEPRENDSSSNILVVVFVRFQDESTKRKMPDARPSLLRVPAEVEGKLAKHLPAYMMPSLLISMSELPTAVTGKIDRKRLREIGAQFSVEQLEAVRTAEHGLKRQPTSEVERVMRNLWAKILNVSADSIGIDDSFFRLGGDSILCMKLVGEARRVHINITVSDIFQRETLAELVRGQDLKIGKCL
ncbi:hypothetical protein QQS21_001906 [Conoideocrella luteorostrata]|uniref:Carrier domain-containing protein n=1 Tax=Conoideocrella luteorostrata TaxID=1105319 RepID=A0AAJ0FX16_9HYPO|nr:hypothetical protein QQS21_001906 [Conoideocrella luteorostrata]